MSALAKAQKPNKRNAKVKLARKLRTQSECVKTYRNHGNKKVAISIFDTVGWLSRKLSIELRVARVSQRRSLKGMDIKTV